MGFSSVDDFISEVSTSGKFWRQDFAKLYSGSATATAGRWYDLTTFGGTPLQWIPGNFVANGDFMGGAQQWTLGSAQWSYTPATHLVTKTAGDVTTLTQNTRCVRGLSYSVQYTLTRSAGGVTVSLGGTAGTQRTSSAAYRETLVCGSTANAPITFTPDAAFAGTIDLVSVQEIKGFTPCNQYDECSLWHGGNVSPDTKHLVNMGAWTNAAAGAPGVLMLVDVLGVYPRIPTDTSVTATLLHSDCLYNGGFTGNADGWTLDTGWTYNSNAIDRAIGTVSAAYQPNLPIKAGCPYVLTYSISNYSAGTVFASLGGTSGTTRNGDGTFVQTITAGESNYSLIFMPNAAAQLTIDTVSCIPLVPRCDETGVGARVCYVLDQSNGANASNFVLTYTNQSGVTNRNLGATVANTASAIVSHLPHSGVAANNFGPMLPLSAGDTGIQKVETARFSAAQATAAGAVNVILFKPIAGVPITTAFIAAERDLMNQLPSLPRIRDGACLCLFLFAGGATLTATQYQGYCDFAWG